MASKKSDIVQGVNETNFNEMREKLHRQMLDAVSHDLKTPLSTVIGSLEIYHRMADKLSEDKKNVLLTTALSEAYRLDNFITNILDMAKLEGDNVSAKSENCNLTQMINDCLTRLGPKRQHCDISLKPSGNTVTVHIDPMLLARALSLVLENAAKHCGKTPTVEVEYGSDDNHAYIHVRDNGPGIPQGKEEEIFLKYTRIARADHQNAGTGLGLALCRKLMSLLSGQVGVKNHPGGGAVFSLTFPHRLQNT